MGRTLCGGSLTNLSRSQGADSRSDARNRHSLSAAKARPRCYFSLGGKLLGVIAVADVIKADSPQAVRELQNMGIRVVMLTGDNERTAVGPSARRQAWTRSSRAFCRKARSWKSASSRRRARSPWSATASTTAGTYASGYRRCHRRGHRRRHRRGGRCAHEEPSARCSAGYHPPEPRDAPQYPRKPFLGVFLQRHRHSASRRVHVRPAGIGR